jgi:RimJ/RimL family protein N-acetyltransferase
MPDLTTQAPSDQAFPTFLVGQSVSLRSLELRDVDALWHWFADREVVRYSLSMWLFPASRHETQSWLERTITDKHTLTLGVVERSSDSLIGFAGLASISLINRSGEYFILIGNKACWSKGYGTEVTQLVVAYGFATLNLHRIALTVSDVNRAGVTAYERAGFTREGVLRQACYRDGQYHDKLVMSILRPEWETRREETTQSSRL